MKNVQIAVVGVLSAACAAFGEISIRSDYPGGNVKVCGIDEANDVVRIAPDLRDTQGWWFHWDFNLRGARPQHAESPRAHGKRLRKTISLTHGKSFVAKLLPWAARS